MENKLQQYFPMIRTKEELLKEIHNNRKLERVFNSWQEEQKQEFVDFCTGACGVKMLYDFMAKEEPFSILSGSENYVPLSVRITSKSLENSKSPNNFFKCIKTSVTYWERLYGSR